MDDEQIKHMVSRFLGWPLPENFQPDAGISFKAEFNEHMAHPMRHKPIGTNLLDAGQAEAMIRYLIQDLPPSKHMQELESLVEQFNDGHIAPDDEDSP